MEQNCLIKKPCWAYSSPIKVGLVQSWTVGFKFWFKTFSQWAYWVYLLCLLNRIVNKLTKNVKFCFFFGRYYFFWALIFQLFSDIFFIFSHFFAAISAFSVWVLKCSRSIFEQSFFLLCLLSLIVWSFYTVNTVNVIWPYLITRITFK